MPGIHVRTLSQFDWLDQEKESLITIPGSYWLCHKKNIYKFIFRYHRTVKNTIKFSYGRELLKIIRRIIKCHPTQGQQFGTQHLLVTYNCTSWTRQDKMFAILKFQQQTNAATFSHAFVLTIRICPSSEQSLFNLKYPIVKEADAGATFKDLNDTLDIEEKTSRIMIHTTDKTPLRKSTICRDEKIDEISKHDDGDTSNESTSINSNLQNNTVKKSENFRESLDDRIKTAATHTVIDTCEKHKLNTEFHDNVMDKSINCNNEKFEKDTKHAIDHRQEESLKAIKKKNEIGVKTSDYISKKTEDVIMQEQEQYQEIQESIQKYKVFSSSKPLTRIIKDGTDTDVPYQYFIEKEIEDAKRNKKSDTFLQILDKPIQKNLQQHNTFKIRNKDITLKTKKNNDESMQKEYCNKIPNFKLQENHEQCTPFSLSSDNNELQHNSYKSCKIRKSKSKESEKKTDKILRSSNITDLVMEGLMFTIRQDQDSVAVIEQKTKLEVDEVLENSEKVETEAGEKCLLNSSLLRLENLITMIDSPHYKNEQNNKNNHTIGNNAYPLSFNGFVSGGPVYNSDDINYVNRTMDKSNISDYDKCKTTDQLNPCESQWQHQCVYSSNMNNDSCSMSRNTKEKKKQLIKLEDSDNEQNKRYMHGDKTEIEKEKEIKEDIIPEILQSTIFSSEKINAGLNTGQNTGLLMDDIEDMDIEETAKCDTSTKQHNNSFPFNPLSISDQMSMKTSSTISEKPRSIKHESNVPRIVSNKAITVEQMPLALQKVLRHTCKKRKLPTTSSESLSSQKRKMQYTTITENATPKTNVSTEKECIDTNETNKSLFTEIATNVEEINSKNELYVTINKNDPETDSNICAKNMKRKSNEIYRNSRTSLSHNKHGSLRKLQDITEDFYYDLHVHNKDNAIRQRCLRQRRRSLNNPDDNNGKVRIEMLKFIQDMTEGAKVVVRRLNIDNHKSSLLEKNSTSTTCIH